jgi:hypothetical protein
VPIGLVAVFVGLAHGEDITTELGRGHLAEFRFAGTGRPIDQDVDAAALHVQGAAQQAQDEVALGRDVSEIGAAQLRSQRRADQPALDIGDALARRQ